MDSSGIKILARLAYSGHVYGNSGDYYKEHILKVVAMLERRRDCSNLMLDIAYLHDVVEDCGVSCSELYELGVNIAVVSGVEILSRLKSERYDEYICRVMTCGRREVRIVKMADLICNIMAGGLEESHRARYMNALMLLMSYDEEIDVEWGKVIARLI